MARIRSIKPEFWSDEKLSECSLSARLLFIGLWSFADDEGRMEYQPARIRMQVFPCGSVNSKQISELIGELTERSLIRVYTVDSRQYLDVPNFAKHQRINRPTPSKIPEYSLLAHGAFSESSPLEGKGREGSGGESPLTESKPVKQQAAKSKRSDRADRMLPLPTDFGLTPDRQTYAEQHLPSVDANALMQKFQGLAKAKGWKYVDWNQAWQTMVRDWSPNSGHWSAGHYPRRGGVQPNGKDPYLGSV